MKVSHILYLAVLIMVNTCWVMEAHRKLAGHNCTLSARNSPKGVEMPRPRKPLRQL